MGHYSGRTSRGNLENGAGKQPGRGQGHYVNLFAWTLCLLDALVWKTNMVMGFGFGILIYVHWAYRR